MRTNLSIPMRKGESVAIYGDSIVTLEKDGDKTRILINAHPKTLVKRIAGKLSLRSRSKKETQPK